MRDVKRISGVLKEVGKIWKQQPDLRLMQLLTITGVNFYTEDEELVRRVKKLPENSSYFKSMEELNG